MQYSLTNDSGQRLWPSKFDRLFTTALWRVHCDYTLGTRLVEIAHLPYSVPGCTVNGG